MNSLIIFALLVPAAIFGDELDDAEVVPDGNSTAPNISHVVLNDSSADGQSGSRSQSSSSILLSTLGGLSGSLSTAAPNRPQSNLPVLPTASPQFVAKGVYVRTSAVQKQCKQNQDCYHLREPDEWCPLPDAAKYADKGCFCDHQRNFCVIQRVNEKGGDEFTDCAEKSISACSGYKPVLRVQQQSQQHNQ